MNRSATPPPRRRATATATALQPAKAPHSRRVLLLIDYINPLDFPGSELLAEPALAAARSTSRLKKHLAQAGTVTIYANDNYGRWQSDFQDMVDHLHKRQDTAARVVRLLAPKARDLTLLKPRHSAFYASALELLLKEMGTRELVLCGLATDICVQMTAMDAFLRGFKLWVPHDCSAAQTQASHDASMAYMAQVLRCDVRPSTAVTRR